MASKNSRKEYLENSFYHAYNRGVEKRIIFQDGQDYGVFLSYLKDYLLPKDEDDLYKQLANASYHERDKILKLLRLNNFEGEIKLLAYCLMPNHFHFLIWQKNLDSMDKFMNSLCTRYASYFNRRHKRVGKLYQDVYKAVQITNDPQLTHLSRYIHKQALGTQDQVLHGYQAQRKNQPSSYPEYLGQRSAAWVKPDEVLAFFSNNSPALTYESFVTENNSSEEIATLLLEDLHEPEAL
ncbi:MAG: transposase [bacterium]|nr:transposase [bacterium]